MNKLQQIQTLKQEAVQEILDNPNLSKVEKLCQISENKLWKYEPWIQHVFAAQEKVFAAQLKETGETCIIIDDFICDPDGGWQRHQDIDLSSVAGEQLWDDGSGEIVVLTARGNDLEFKMKLDEIVDVIYNWCVENKSIGFKMDW